MLQELTEDDFKNVHKQINKKELLKVYNVIKKYQEEIGIIKNYYFDDNFCWRRVYGSKNSVLGTTLYDCSLNLYGSAIKYRELIKKFLKKEGISINEYHLESCIQIIFNKLRPTDEYYKNYFKKTILEEKKIRQVNISKEENKENKIAECKINEKKNFKKATNAYIYGIYIDNKLVYIGKTTREMKHRLGEHLEYALLGEGGGAQQNYLYKAMRECEVGYKFKILYKSHNTISNHELEEIEKTLIENLKPEFNYEGVKVPYRFSS